MWKVTSSIWESIWLGDCSRIPTLTEFLSKLSEFVQARKKAWQCTKPGWLDWTTCKVHKAIKYIQISRRCLNLHFNWLTRKHDVTWKPMRCIEPGTSCSLCLSESHPVLWDRFITVRFISSWGLWIYFRIWILKVELEKKLMVFYLDSFRASRF